MDRSHRPPARGKRPNDQDEPHTHRDRAKISRIRRDHQTVSPSPGPSLPSSRRVQPTPYLPTHPPTNGDIRQEHRDWVHSLGPSNSLFAQYWVNRRGLPTGGEGADIDIGRSTDFFGLTPTEEP